MRRDWRGAVGTRARSACATAVLFCGLAERVQVGLLAFPGAAQAARRVAVWCAICRRVTRADLSDAVWNLGKGASGASSGAGTFGRSSVAGSPAVLQAGAAPAAEGARTTPAPGARGAWRARSRFCSGGQVGRADSLQLWLSCSPALPLRYPARCARATIGRLHRCQATRHCSARKRAARGADFFCSGAPLAHCRAARPRF